MIARLKVMLPYEFQLPQPSELKPFMFKNSGCRVTVHAPYRLAIDGRTHIELTKYPLDYVFELLGAAPAEQHTSPSIKINGHSPVVANVLVIDFQRQEFDRRRELKTPDPSDEFLFDTANHVLSVIRTVIQSAHVDAVGPKNVWRLDYLDDDGLQLRRDDTKWRRRFSANWSYRFAVLNVPVWEQVARLVGAYEPPVWNHLLLDSEAFVADIGPALVLAYAALESMIAKVLDFLADERRLNPELWKWINNRENFMKDPSVAEQFDVLLSVFAGKSLKSEPGLWTVFQHLRQARNSFVHQGVAVMGRDETKVDLHAADRLIQGAKAIATWVENLLPESTRRPVLLQENTFELIQQLASGPSDGEYQVGNAVEGKTKAGNPG